MGDPTEVDTTGHDPATAYHEAGHAVAALALGRPVHRVSVLPRQTYLGTCEFAPGRTKPTDDWLEDEILIALAGMVAESRHTGRYCRAGASRDLRYVRRLALGRVGERQLERYERRMVAKTEHLLSDDHCHSAVVRVAAELLKSGQISGRATRHFFERERPCDA